MKNLRKQFELFCYKNRNKGVPNLMLYIVLGTAAVYLMSRVAGNYFLYNLLYFDRNLILRGQVWRLITYPLTQTHSDVPEDMRRRLGITDTLLRLSVGIEDVNDLLADLTAALEG